MGRVRHLIIPLVTAMAGVACSSSRAIKTSRDAAVSPDLASDLSGRDLAAGSGDLASSGPDLETRDLATPGSDLADLRRADQSAPDTHPAQEDVAGARKDGAISDRDVHPGDAGDVSRQDRPSPDLPRDAPTEHGQVCTPGADQTCNDEPWASAIWGRCIAGETCICNAGFVVNPATGRCMIAPESDASTGGDTDPICPGKYDACGCGCCESTPRDLVCYFPTAGDALEAIKAADDEVRSTTNCTTAGCTAGKRHVCCLPAPPEPAASASYAASGDIGGNEHVFVTKTGDDCAGLTFMTTSSPHPAYRVESPRRLGLIDAVFGACGDGGAREQAKGALGTLDFRASGEECLVDVHVTLFAFTTAGEVKTVRLDADGLELQGGLGFLFCE